MLWFRLAVLYTALAVSANTAAADTALLKALRAGSLAKLTFLATPAPVPRTAFFDPAGHQHTLAEFRGKYVLLNFWATWCAPCRKEMPELDALNARFGTPSGGTRFAVVTVAIGRNPPAAIARFFATGKITTLPRFRDPHQKLAREMAVFGLPTTVLIDPEGREIARLRGDAAWNGPSARAIVTAMLAAG